MRQPARRSSQAIERVLERGTELTGDLGGSGTTTSLGTAIAEEIARGS